MAAAQLTDDGIANMRSAPTGLVVREIPLNTNGPSIYCDVSTGRPRPLVPDTWQRTVFDAVHGLSHPSIRTTRKMIAEKFVWRGLNKQVGAWAKSCLRCQAAKVHRHTASPVADFAPTTRRFDHVHVDLVGPLPPSQNHRYLFTVVDRFTRWAEAIPLVDAQTTTCARAFAAHWLHSLHMNHPIHLLLLSPFVITIFIETRLRNLPENKYVGLDRLSGRLLRAGAPVISQLLAFILNFSLKSGKFKGVATLQIRSIRGN